MKKYLDKFIDGLSRGKPILIAVSFVMLTQCVLLTRALLSGSVSFFEVAVTGAIMFIQLVIGYSPKVRDLLLPLCPVVDPKRNRQVRVLSRAIGLLLPVVFLIAPISVTTAIVVILAIVLLGMAWLLRSRMAIAKTEIRNYAAEIVVYIAGDDNFGYQVNQWLPVLDKLNHRVAILARNQIGAESITPSSIPIYFARSIREVEWVLNNGPEKVLYPANPNSNVHALRYPSLEHIFINHGESDKAVNQTKFLMAYDKILVGGPMAEQRMLNAGLPIRDNHVVHVGRPQAEMLLEKKIERSCNVKKILYAPTWEGYVQDVEYASVSNFGLSILEQLSKISELEVCFKPHPFTGHSKKIFRLWLKKFLEFCEQHQVRVLGNNDSLFEAMNWSDLLITDISSVLNDYLVTNKPILLCNVPGLTHDQLRQQFPSSAAAYVLNKDQEIAPLLSELAVSDPNYETRLEVRIKSVGHPDDNAFERFAEAVRGEESSGN